MFQPDDLKKLKDGYSQVFQKYKNLLLMYMRLELDNPEAQEYKQQGFLRRINTLKRCVQNVYEICPPDKSDKPSNDELIDLAINIQSFVFTIFGCIDNLAWIWVKENNFQCRKKEVCFSNPKIKNKLSPEFREYIDSDKFKKWFKSLEDFRHALAHRIPLYVPPSILTSAEAEKSHDFEKQKWEIHRNVSSLTNQTNGECLPIAELNNLLALQDKKFEKMDQLSLEQDNLGKFVPVMTHSFNENSPQVDFHDQLLKDWNMIIELSSLFLNALNDQKKKCLENT